MERNSNYKKQILLIDEQPICRLGLENILFESDEFELAAFISSVEESLLNACNPDLVLIDIVVDKSRGIGVIKDLKRRYASAPILVATSHDETLFAERCLRAGAKGLSHEDPVN